LTGPSRRASGFTLIELMIVVAIIGILAAIAIPKFADLVRKASEGNSKGSLASIRSALSVYYGDMEGQYPMGLGRLTVGGKYLAVIAVSKEPNYHPDVSTERDALLSSPSDGGGWLYDNTLGDANMGEMLVNCTHTDSKGSVWTSY
jgi:prepilin-type N-terminal cleavage/methylation domain-containing protein